MKNFVNRRDFLAAAAATGAGLTLIGRGEAAPMKTTLHKALIGHPTEQTLAAWKAAGIEGIEATTWNVKPTEAAKVRKVADKFGMKIHSVMRAWVNFNSSDPAAVQRDIASVETALGAAQAYGADAILLVPCRTGGMPMPEPWEFNIEFDPKTGHLNKVVAGDNAPFREYIAAHDHATDTSRAALRTLIPMAEKTGVVIALENVWNNLWVKPDVFRHFVASFESPWIRAYFDIGNHVKYAPSEEWIRSLGKLIVKCHVKDFKLNPDGHGGSFCTLREGSVDWPLVRRELDTIGYNGWMTLEDGHGLSVDEMNRRLDLIIAGK